MSRRCELTGVNRQIGHKVSHSNIKTKREFKPNLVDVTLSSDALGQTYKLRITAAALRTVDHRGGLDAFLLKAKRSRAFDARRQDPPRPEEEAGRNRRGLRPKLMTDAALRIGSFAGAAIIIDPTFLLLAAVHPGAACAALADGGANFAGALVFVGVLLRGRTHS